jgi:tetratricopeptide (TPR) repeat protein
MAVLCCTGIACTVTLQANPSALYRPKVKDLVRTQGWDSIENWQQMRDQAENLMSWGMYEDAAKAYQAADVMLQRQKGAQHPMSLRNRADLANALMRQGKPEGEKQLREVFELQKKRLAPDDPDLLLTRHLLANLLIARWELEAAEKELRDIVKSRALKLGPGNEATLASRTNLSYVFTRLLRYPEAEEQLRLVLAAQIQNLGLKDLETCATRERLGDCFQSQSKFDDALAEYRAVLLVLSKEYGPRHPLTFRAQQNLAGVLFDQGKHELAEQDYRELAEALTKLAGPEEPHTLAARGGIAACLRSRGKLAEAEKELRDILDICSRTQAKESPEMQDWRNELANVLLETRKVDEAERLFNITLDQRRKLLGSNDPLTLNSWRSMAQCMAMRGNTMAAELELRQLVQVRTVVQGPYHAATLNDTYFLADMMRSNGRPEQALPIFRDMLDLFQKYLGPLNPATLDAKYYVAITLDGLGRVDESMAMQRQLLKDRERIAGRLHQETLRIRLRVAGNLMEAGRFQESEAQYVQVLVDTEQSLGSTHPLTVAGLWGYGRMLAVCRRAPEAEKVARQGIRSTASFGETNVEMLRFKELLGLVLVQQGRGSDAEGVASELEHLFLRQEGRLEPEIMCMAGMVAWVKLSTGREDEARAVLLKTLAQLKNLGFDKTQGIMLKMKCLEALMLSQRGEKEQAETLIHDLGPQLQKEYRDGEPIMALARGLEPKMTKSYPVMLHAIEFSRLRTKDRLTEYEKVNGDVFPPGATAEQKKMVHEAFMAAQNLADKNTHAEALEKFAVYLRVSTEVAGEHSLLALGAHLSMAREATILNRPEVTQEHARAAADILSRFPEGDGTRKVVEFLLRTKAVQDERGNPRAASIFGKAVVSELNLVLGTTHLTTLSCSSVMVDIMISMGDPLVDTYLPALTKTCEETLGKESPFTVSVRLKLMQLYIAKKNFHGAHTLAHQLELPVRLLYGESSEKSLYVREVQAAALEGQGLLSMAIVESRLVLADCERISGEEALSTVLIRHRLAQMYQRGNQFPEALRLEQINLKILQYPSTEKSGLMAEVKLNIAIALVAMQRRKEGEEFARQAAALARGAYGPNSDSEKWAGKIIEAAKNGVKAP